MHIAFVHNAVVPPKKYGGTERIIAWLIQGLHELGHSTTLIARPGSFVPGSQLIELKETTNWEEILPSCVDVTHLWSTPGRTPRFPHVVTIEGNGQPGETFLPNTVFISKKHAENHCSGIYVYNGINLDDYPCDEKRENYAVFLAKASWSVKNLEGAIFVARKAGIRLEVLGSRDWPLGLHRLFPPIRGVHYRGMVGDQEKREVLRRARALLFPVRWHEPFGIALTEALASGCPVLGTPYGSLPEIVTKDVGVLSTDAATLISTLKSSLRFHPQACRQRVSQGFTHLDMARAYLSHYESVRATGRLSTTEKELYPRTKEGFEANRLLAWSDSDSAQRSGPANPER